VIPIAAMSIDAFVEEFTKFNRIKSRCEESREIIVCLPVYKSFAVIVHNMQNIILLSRKLHSKSLNDTHWSLINRIVAGAYHGNRMFLGTGNDTGILLGYEMKLNKRWYLMGDWVSGSNNEGVAVLGGMYNLSKRVQLCAGWLLPNENNPKPQGVVLEINILTWDLF
jgi:hypothetical protein